MYAESVAELEARLHRLSVDRQMLSDEFSDARRALEQQVAEATARAEAGRSETSVALDTAVREATEARSSAAAYADRAAAASADAEKARGEATEALKLLDDEKRRRHADGDQLSTLRADLDVARDAASASRDDAKRLAAKVAVLEADLARAKAAGDAARTKLAALTAASKVDAITTAKKKKKKPPVGDDDQ